MFSPLLPFPSWEGLGVGWEGLGVGWEGLGVSPLLPLLGARDGYPDQENVANIYQVAITLFDL
ncbi:hypothetical protein [Okeania sp. SIO2B3]|uniref:hypothetical protein n=1 Tax=Okeania sp. SIO2B3 TaxID=2607784 RepID=UPI0013C092FE|nr:hypothetical protein [Okeania sp. SIO2B3]NET46941.1 hypothetical protein [Okeania sp. SIO2B3]